MKLVARLRQSIERWLSDTERARPHWRRLLATESGGGGADEPLLDLPPSPGDAAWALIEHASTARATPAARREGVVDTPRALARAVARALPPARSAERILDLCCGPGALLLAIFEQRRGEGVAPGALLEGLHGIDSDVDAVEVCRLVLAVASAGDPGIGASIGDNIRVGDALAPPLSAASFDVVVANPPYRRAGRRARDLEGFETLHGAFDLFVPFIERGVSWLKPGGAGVFLTSNKHLIADYGQRLRAHLLERCHLRLLFDLGATRAFSAQVEAAITVVFRRPTPTQTTTLALAEGPLESIEGDVQRALSLALGESIEEPTFRAEAAPCSVLPWTPGGPTRPWAIRAMGARRVLLMELMGGARIGDRLEVFTGVMGFAYRSALESLTEDASARRGRVITPGNLRAFDPAWGRVAVRLAGRAREHPVIATRPGAFSARSWQRLQTPKVMISGISPRGLLAAADPEGGFLPMVAVHMIPCEPAEALAITGLLNSLVLRWCLQLSFAGARIPQGSQRVSVRILRLLPWPPGLSRAALRDALTSYVAAIVTGDAAMTRRALDARVGELFGLDETQLASLRDDLSAQ